MSYFTQNIGKDLLFFESYGLNSLIGAPKQIKGNFIFDARFLKNFEGAPNKVLGDFRAFDLEKLTSLEGSPKYVGGNFLIADAWNLTSLEGSPKYVGRDYLVNYCPKLIFSDGISEHIGGVFAIDGEVVKNFEDKNELLSVLSKMKTKSALTNEIVEELGFFKGRKSPLCLVKFSNGLYSICDKGHPFLNPSLSDKSPEKAIENFAEETTYSISEDYKEGSEPRSFYIDTFKFGNGKYSKFYKKVLEDLFDEYGIY